MLHGKWPCGVGRQRQAANRHGAASVRIREIDDKINNDELKKGKE